MLSGLPTSRIDVAALRSSTEFLGLRIPASSTQACLERLEDHLLRQRGVSFVRTPADRTHRILVLKYPDLENAPDEVTVLGDNPTYAFVSVSVERGYKQMTAPEVFGKCFPEGVPIIRSFEQVGHIAHLNLLSVHEPFKHFIGKVILEKNPTVRTVVTKVGSLGSSEQNVFRVLPFELLAGVAEYVVDVREYGSRYQFDYSKVYWNSRLQLEHQRITDFVSSEKQEIVCDMFAGVGPFVVPICQARPLVTAYANDLNPDSAHWLKRNIELNRLEGRIIPFNRDARVFLRFLVQEMAVYPTQVIMNLPGSAIDFLDAFVGLYPLEVPVVIPLVHCYSFEKVDSTAPNGNGVALAKRVLVERVCSVLGIAKSGVDFVEIADVRDVSTSKRMFRISFRPPERVLRTGKRSRRQGRDSGSEQEQEGEGSPATKRLRRRE